MVLPLLYLNKNVGVREEEVSKNRYRISLILFLLASINSAVVPAGGGTIMLLIIITGIRLEFVSAYATISVGELFLQLISSSIYFTHGYLDALSTTAFIVGSAIGSRLGSRIAITKGNVWVRQLLVFVVVLSVIKIFIF